MNGPGGRDVGGLVGGLGFLLAPRRSARAPGELLLEPGETARLIALHEEERDQAEEEDPLHRRGG
jgi:hypothetical protein